MNKPNVTDPIIMAISGKVSEILFEFDDSELEVTVKVVDIVDEAIEIPREIRQGRRGKNSPIAQNISHYPGGVNNTAIFSGQLT